MKHSFPAACSKNVCQFLKYDLVVQDKTDIITPPIIATYHNNLKNDGSSFTH